MKQHLAQSLVMACLASAAGAADRTWDGGGAGANWTAPANWDGDASAPSSGDALFFGGSAKLTNTNDFPADTAFAGLTFNSGAGAFVLDGNSLALGGDVRNLSSSAQTLNLPLNLGATRMFYGAGAGFTAKGALSGSGGLIVNVTNATLTLSGSNSYDGVTAVTNGCLSVTHASALGSTNGNTVVYSRLTGCMQISGGIVLAEPLTLSGQRPSYGYSLLNASGSNTISAPITRVNEIRINSNGGSTLVITGGVLPGGGSGDMVLNSSGTIAFYNTPVNLVSYTFWTDSGGLTVVGVSGNTWGNALVASGTLRLDITNALPAASTLTVGVGYGPNGTVNLNGNSQTVGQLVSGTFAAGTRTITSPTPAVLTVNQSASTVFDGQWTGAAGLTKTGAGTLTLSNSLSTTTGNITVSNGTLAVATSSGLGNSTNVTVQGGTLELRASACIADAAALSIADDGAKVKLGAALAETVSKLYLNGVQQRSGTWGATGSGATHVDDAHFSGAGLLTVLYSPPVSATAATWDAGGTDTLLSTTNNWAGDALPAFDGTTFAVFGTSGATATVDKAVSLYGIAFNRDGNFTLANGDGALALGAGGIAATLPSATSRTYTLAEDLTLEENQAWAVTNNGAGVATLTVSGSIGDGSSAYGLSKYGTGTLVLSGSNSYDGVTSIKTNGVIRITNASALGSTNGATVVEDCGGWLEVNGGITVPEPLAINGDVSTSYSGALRSTGGSNVWSGLITHINSRIRCTSGSLDIVGGLAGNSMVLGADGGTFIRVAEKPVNIGGGTFYAHTGSLLILAAASNVWNNMEISGNYIRTDVANALPPAGTVTMGGSSLCGLNLNGKDQTVGGLVSTYTAAGTRIVFSAAPATLTVSQSANTTFNGSMTGAVTVVKTGTGNLVLTGTNTTYGGYVVSNGTLTVSDSGTLGATGTNVVLAGGTLLLSNSVAVASSAVVRMPDAGVSTAKISLASGVNQKVGWLYYGTQMQRVGTYGSSASGAGHKDDTHFAGAGMLTVMHDNSGTVFTLR